MKSPDRAELSRRLQAFALARLQADKHPDCSHRCRDSYCDSCRVNRFRLRVEHHEGDEPGDFRGVIRATCADCGAVEELMSVVAHEPSERKVERTEIPHCDCGGDVFAVGSCDRWEDWGFFDEGTWVAACCACGREQSLADTD